MSIILEGEITNKLITGTNGEFSVGNFVTDIGKFKIRSTLLDQFDEGEYQARVVCNKIDLNSYMARRSGIVITEMELCIDHLEILDAEVKTITEEPIEPDASVADDEAKVKVTKAAIIPSRQGVKAIPLPSDKPDSSRPVESNAARLAPTEGTTPDDVPPEILFGHIWPLGKKVELDTTTPRPQFIKQKKHLNDLGYVFDSLTQTWSLI